MREKRATTSDNNDKNIFFLDIYFMFLGTLITYRLAVNYFYESMLYLALDCLLRSILDGQEILCGLVGVLRMLHVQFLVELKNLKGF